MDILYTDKFLKSAKKLSKRYKNLKKDLKSFTDSLKDDPKQGIELFENVYKVRVRNSDNNKGKSGGYRVIVYLLNKYDILLVDIYSKSDLSNLTDVEIDSIIKSHLVSLVSKDA